MTGVVIVRERCAKTDPPQPFSDLVWTDQGLARYGGPRWLPRDSGHGVAWWRLDLGGGQLWPPPLWWYDLRPTANERLGLGVSGGSPPPKGFEIVRETATQPLTIEHLEDLYEHAVSPPNTTWSRYVRIAAARLRAALDALNTRNGDNGGQSN